MVKMGSYEAFLCLCGAGDVPRENTFRCKFFYGKRNESVYKLVLLELQRLQFILQDLHRLSSTPPRYSSGSSSTLIHSPGTSRNTECSNCKHLLDKITVLQATVDMYMHQEQHTVNSTALFHEVYNNIGKLDLE
ncbi:hypothetical protein Tco_1454732 [Tanacetum coccineum]